MRRLIVCFVSFAMIGSLSSVPAWAGESEPFVAGYDRFYSKNDVQDATAGQLLLTELSCTACHQAEEWLSPKGGPQLNGVLARLQPSWVRSYLDLPSGSKPGGVMPHLLHQIPESERARTIDAILAFLSQSDANEPKIVASGGNPVAHEFWLKGDVVRGRGLYHQIGCVACHVIDSEFPLTKTTQSDLERKIESLGLEPNELEEMGLAIPKPVQPVPMSSISKKYTLRSLSMFLIAPHLVRPSGRMPSLKLQPHEAADIAAYLFRNTPVASSSDATPIASNFVAANASINAVLVAHGKQVFEKLACVNCHAQQGTVPRFAKPLTELDISGNDKGCLAGSKSSPQFGLSDPQKKALKAGILNVQRASPTSEHDDLALRLLQLNCYACHERGGRGGTGPAQGPYFENVQLVDIGDEGRMPPPLDHVGRKLTKSWIQKVLEGKGDVRPHFRSRMPIFSDHAKTLAAALEAADQHGLSKTNATSDIVNAPLADLEAGRELLDAGCVQCHALRGESLPGSIGIDLADIATRVQPEWFHAFLLNPASLKKNTRMPSFFPDGKSSNPHILDGNITLQIASLWRYLNAKDQPLPSKLEQSRLQFFELKPIDKPILLRTFMEASSGGTQAIAVGFPEQFHFAFDSKNLRLAEVWKGGFLNAQGTWFDRFAPPAIPLGTGRMLFPMEPFVVIESDGTVGPISAKQKSFLGYRLDSKGIPTLRYKVRTWDIEDRIETDREKGLVRRISSKTNDPSDASKGQSLWLVLTDDAIETDTYGVCSTRSGLTLKVSDRVEHQLRKHDELSDWMIAIPTRQESIEVRYQW